ncbi:MAG: DUF2341 domain-containing protein [Thermoplasmata archaeon]|nr:DUF2341 domain-containing protein [Thermoplasmata archaeon]
MRKNWIKKSLICGIIILMVGASVVSAIYRNPSINSTPMNQGNWLYVGESGPGNDTNQTRSDWQIRRGNNSAGRGSLDTEHHNVKAIIEERPSGNITISNPYPTNGSLDISVEPQCNITVNHSDGCGMTVSWYENSTGSWVQRQTNGSTHWYHADWSYRKLITIDHTKIPSTLINFPVLVSLATDANLAADAQNDGDDICFVKYSDNTTKLNHEIEWFNGTSGNLYAWVNVTSVSSISDTKIWMYYGNSVCDSQQNTNGVWDSHFGAVWHMQEIDAVDSTSNGNTGSDTGAPLIAAGVVNNSVDFVPTDYISVGTGASIDTADDNTVTWECWINGDSNAGDQVFLEQSQGSNSWNVVLGTYDADVATNAIKWITRDDDGTGRDTVTSEVSITTGSWMHVAGTYNNGTSDNKSIYVNGVLKAYTTAGINNLRSGPTTATHIGYGGDFGPYDGKIDEVRMSSNVRNASWINATYQTIATPSTFFSTGGEQSLIINGTYRWIFTQASASATMYYWKVAVNDTYHTSTAIYHFTTAPEPNQPPYAPSNPTPPNGAMNVNITSDIHWTGGDPDPGDTVTYDVYFGESSSPPKLVSNQSGLSYDPGTLAYNTLYHWRIVAWDVHSASSAGPLWYFKTVYIPNRPPYAPCNPSPANGSTEVSMNVDLCWSGGDPDSGDWVTYDIYFGISFPLTKIASNTSGTSHALDHLLYDTKYYWKIVSWDNHGASNMSPLWSFTTQTDSTGPIVKITSPIKGFLYINFWDIITRKIPIFITTFVVGKIEVTATATDSESGVSRVEFYIDNELKANDTSAPYSWIWLEREFFFPCTLKVIAYDNAGNQNSSELKVWKIF